MIPDPAQNALGNRCSILLSYGACGFSWQFYILKKASRCYAQQSVQARCNYRVGVTDRCCVFPPRTIVILTVRPGGVSPTSREK